jgi:hypothetical protein
MLEEMSNSESSVESYAVKTICNTCCHIVFKRKRCRTTVTIHSAAPPRVILSDLNWLAADFVPGREKHVFSDEYVHEKSLCVPDRRRRRSSSSVDDGSSTCHDGEPIPHDDASLTLTTSDVEDNLVSQASSSEDDGNGREVLREAAEPPHVRVAGDGRWNAEGEEEDRPARKKSPRATSAKNQTPPPRPATSNGRSSDRESSGRVRSRSMPDQRTPEIARLHRSLRYVPSSRTPSPLPVATDQFRDSYRSNRW